MVVGDEGGGDGWVVMDEVVVVGIVVTVVGVV